VAKGRPGDTLKLSILRGGKPRTVEIKSGVRPTEKELSLNDDDSDDGRRRRSDQAAGPEVGSPGHDPGADRRRGPHAPTASSRRRGVLIDGVKANSDAGEKGLRKGDVLTSVNGDPVTSAGAGQCGGRRGQEAAPPQRQPADHPRRSSDDRAAEDRAVKLTVPVSRGLSPATRITSPSRRDVTTTRQRASSIRTMTPFRASGDVVSSGPWG
jgi:hypothetical protein